MNLLRATSTTTSLRTADSVEVAGFAWQIAVLKGGALRGFKVDHMQTALARLEGDFLLTDPRSFVSLPKVTNHTNGAALPHFVLHGKDKCAMRAEIFRLNRQPDGRNVCTACWKTVFENSAGAWSGDVGHWHHINSKAGQRCDCSGNGELLCPACHLGKGGQHVQVEWSKSA